MTEQPANKTITLKKPVSFGTETFDRLELREPTVGELRRAQKDAVGDQVLQTINLITILTGIPQKAVEDIGIGDIEEADDYIGGFTKAGRAIAT